MLCWCSRNGAVTTAQIVWLPRLFGAGVAAAVAIEAGHRVAAAELEFAAEHVPFGHPASIALRRCRRAVRAIGPYASGMSRNAKRGTLVVHEEEPFNAETGLLALAEG